MASERIERTLEQLQEDEALFGDLDDAAAAALRQWLEQRVVAADAAADDAEFTRQVADIRAAAKIAARSAVHEPAALTRQAEQALRGDLSRSVAPAVPDESPSPTRDVRRSPAAALLQPPPAAPVDPPPAAGTPSAAQTSEPPTPESAEPITDVAAAPRSIWSGVRRRVRRWTQRKARS